MASSLEALDNFAAANSHVSESISVIEEAFRIYGKYGICLSFNGGKDCTALLYLVYNVAIRLFKSERDFKLRVFYVKLPNAFDEERNFVAKCITRYDLDVLQYSGTAIKSALFKLKSDHPSIGAIFVGTRSVDLEQKMGTFQPTDPGWPEYMRINPILNWTYRQVWDFILALNVPYCDLYDQGYSSLGTEENTRKNSSLFRYDEHGKGYYLPAWNLEHPEDERQSRRST